MNLNPFLLISFINPFIPIEQRLQQKSYLTTSDRISPPSTTSRLSDSDISELDYDDGFNTSRGNSRLITHINKY